MNNLSKLMKEFGDHLDELDIKDPALCGICGKLIPRKELGGDYSFYIPHRNMEVHHDCCKEMVYRHPNWELEQPEFCLLIHFRGWLRFMSRFYWAEDEDDLEDQENIDQLYKEHYAIQKKWFPNSYHREKQYIHEIINKWRKTND